MKRRPRLTAAIAGLLLIPTIATAVTIATPASATLPAPVILNTGLATSGDAAWLEMSSYADAGGVRQGAATFLVQHPVGRTITGVKIDADWNATDNTSTVATTAVTEKAFAPAAGGIETSRVTAIFAVPNGPNLSGRSFNAPFRMRVVDNTNEQSATVTNQMRFVEDGNGFLTADYPRLTQSNQFVDPPEVAPSTAFTVTYTCDDADSDVLGVTTDDECAGAQPRWRRLSDGTTFGLAVKSGGSDNAVQTLTVNTPNQRGYYVLEALLCNENSSCPTDGAGTASSYVRLGAVMVNEAATSMGVTWATTGTQPSSPPSVNPGDPASVVASPTDAGVNAAVQVAEWDSTSNGSFERRAYTVPVVTGGDINHPALTLADRTQLANTTVPGLSTVTARFTDNGSIDAADPNRRQLVSSTQIRVNAVPTASNVTATTSEDNAVTVNLAGNDADNQPDPLTYTIVTQPNPAQGTLDAVSGSSVVFHPAANYNGPASFTYLVDDGTVSTVGAHKASNVATASITVTPVNDLPVIDANAGTTNEDTPGDVQMTGNDIEDGTDLHYTVDTQPTNGSASCTDPGVCTYTPGLNFNGTDSYIVRGTDNEGGSSTATVTMTVNAINDAPVANDQTVNVPEDSVNFPITLSATDVDSLVLNYSGPDDDVDHGTLSCAGEACVYTPTPNYNGPDSFTFTVDDGALSDPAGGTVTINVTAVNDAPVAIDRPDVETDEDIPVTSTLTGTDIDAGDVVTVDHTTDGPNGTTQVVGPNDVTYTPDLNFNGVDTYGFTVTDSNGGFDDGVVTVTVHPVNDAPFVPNQPFTIAEDNPTILSIFAGDVDGDLLDWAPIADPAHGTVVGIGPDLVYIPDVNYVGDDTFVVTVSDGHLSATGTITVHIAPVNDQPVANSSTVTTTEDQAVTFNLSASDPDGGGLTYTAPQAGPLNGTTVCAANSCTYTPNANFNGADQFQFTASDGFLTDSASVTVIVTPVNDPPTASPTTVTTDEDTPVSIPLVATDIDNDALTYTNDAPANGTITGIAPALVYVPNPNWSGTEHIGFTVDDGHGGLDSDFIDITVNAVNDAPVATGGTVSTDEDTNVSFQLGGTDVDSSSLTYTVDTAPSTGTLSCDGAGACTYDPAPDTYGEQLIEYTVSDGFLQSSGVFTVSVAPVNDPPVASNANVTVSEDTPTAIHLGATDTEGDALTYAIVSPAAHGTITCGGADCTYTPAANYSGGDSFGFQASDASSSSNTATVTITVSPVNDAPQALDVAGTTNEDTPVGVTLLATDVDGDPITYSVASAPAHGTVTISGSTATYTPAADYGGPDSFTYRATDPSGAFTTAKVSLVVNEVPLIGTTLTAEPAIVKVLANVLGIVNLNSALVVFPNLTGTLKTASGAPLPGRTIKFTAGGATLCTAVTNAQGVGSCQSTVQSGLAVTLGLGYQVSFAGDLDYSPTSAKSTLIQVLTLKL